MKILTIQELGFVRFWVDEVSSSPEDSRSRLVAQLSQSHLAVSLDNEEDIWDWAQLRELYHGRIHE